MASPAADAAGGEAIRKSLGAAHRDPGVESDLAAGLHREHNPPPRGAPFLALTILVNGFTNQDGAVVLADPLPWPCRPQRLRYELRSQV